MATFFFTCIFLFLNEALRVPNYIGSPPTSKAYCSYAPTFENENVRVSFLMIHLLEKSIYIYTNKMKLTNTEQHKIIKTKLTTLGLKEIVE